MLQFFIRYRYWFYTILGLLLSVIIAYVVYKKFIIEPVIITPIKENIVPEPKAEPKDPLQEKIDTRNKKMEELKIKVYEINTFISDLELDKYASAELYYADKNTKMIPLSVSKMFEMSPAELDLLKQQIQQSGIYIKENEEFVKAKKQ